MIIGKRSGIQTLGALIGELSNTQRSVLRVASGSGRQTFCTGFFIRYDLIVVPAFVFSPPGKPTAVVECYRNGKRDWQQRVSDIELVRAGPDLPPSEITGVGDGSLLALLRIKPIKQTERDPTLELGFEATDPGDFVSVVQFARAEKQHSVSFGTVRTVSDAVLGHDADTELGSSGSPLFDASWRVIGMQFAADATRHVNQAITREAMLAALQTSASWKAIKERHRIADVAAAKQEATVRIAINVQERPEPVLVRAALTTGIEKSSLSEKDADLLRPYVADLSADRWVLRPGERARIIGAGGSLDELRKLASSAPDAESNSLQGVVYRILKGPPYDLEVEDEQSLAWWIQASRWFAGVHPEIPAPSEVTRVLERRRVRGRLEKIAGADFRGRAAELETLLKWWRKSTKPLSLTGIGGIGKSALIARFATKLPEETLLLWLDFDRADLAPDDAPSILSAVAAQAAVQLHDFQAPPITVEGWEKSAATLGERIRIALPPKTAVLLVLDSFEAAQYTKQYQELWPVLESIASSVPALRLVVTGRAPVPELSLRGEKAESIHLRGLAPDDARAWLREHGVTEPLVLNQVLALADGVPLILRLALRFLERGGKIADLPDRLPAEIVAGFLYDRILDRVQNPFFKPIATAALVLRRLTSDMVDPVLRGLVELPPGEVTTWFPDLAREMALVEGTDVLRLRPEVRTPALKLLEKDQPDLARAVEERIADWYAKPERMADPELAAELVYHCLRLGDEGRAEQVWRPECRKYLLDVGDDVLPPVRKWLRAHGVGKAPAGSAAATQEWEIEAAERIRSARSRGHDRVVKEILSERKERSDDSPLIFDEAFERWVEGDPAKAARILAEGGPTTGTIGRNRTLLRALLYAESGDRSAADSELVTLEGEARWSDRGDPSMYALAIRAARIDLALDLEAECKLLAEDPERLHDSGLSPRHAVLPRLSKMLSTGGTVLESVGAVRRLDVNSPAAIEQVAEETVAAYVPNNATSPLAILLTDLGTLRWWLGTASSFLPPHKIPRQGYHPEVTMPWSFLFAAYRVAAGPGLSPFASAIVGTLAVFASALAPEPPWSLRKEGHETVELVGPYGPLAAVVANSPAITKNLRIRAKHWPRALRILSEGVDPSQSWARLVWPDASTRTDTWLIFSSGVRSLPPEQRAPLLHLMTPNVLEQMVREIAGYASEAL